MVRIRNEQDLTKLRSQFVVRLNGPNGTTRMPDSPCADRDLNLVPPYFNLEATPFQAAYWIRMYGMRGALLAISLRHRTLYD